MSQNIHLFSHITYDTNKLNAISKAKKKFKGKHNSNKLGF